MAAEKTVEIPAKKSRRKPSAKHVRKNTRLSTEIKYEKFCATYRKNGGNGTEAAIAAGYSEKTAAVTASKLLRNPKIIRRIEELAKDAVRKNIISADKRAEILSGIALDAGNDVQARVRAIDVLNKMDGLYVVRAEVTVKGDYGVSLKNRRGS